MMDQYRPAEGFMPDPNDLLIFAQVAELGSFSRAADRLGLPKSTVSRRLSALEQGLGERLLWRTTRRQTLTEFGQLLLDHARQVAAEVQAVAALSAHRSAAPSGRLRVSMPSDFANLVLTEPIAAFVALHPGIQLELDLSARRVDLLGEGFDLALRIGALSDDGLLAARRLTVLSSGLYASPQYLAEFGQLDGGGLRAAIAERNGRAPFAVQSGNRAAGVVALLVVHLQLVGVGHVDGFLQLRDGARIVTHG